MTLPDLTRRGRRRLFVALAAGLVGLSVPLWVPRLLAVLPAFRVEHVHVLGTRYVAPDEVTHLMALDPGASVWDDVEPLERQVRAHPMIRDVMIGRKGLHTLEVVVVEKRPVALVATPELRPVNGDGRVLPLEPSESDLDLPIIQGQAVLEDEVVEDPRIREIAGVLEALERSDPEFMSVVSQVGGAPDGGYRFLMLPNADAGAVLLPPNDPARALRRVSLALGQIDDPRVDRADARFAGQVVLTGGHRR